MRQSLRLSSKCEEHFFKSLQHCNILINFKIIFEIMGVLQRNAIMQLLLYYHVMQNVILETGNHQVSLVFVYCMYSVEKGKTDVHCHKILPSMSINFINN